MSPSILPAAWQQLPQQIRDEVVKRLIERRLLQGDVQRTGLVRADRSKPVPASLEQSFFVHQQEAFGGKLAWTMAAPPIILEDVNIDRVRSAIEALAARHDVLHSVFKRSGSGFHLVLDRTRPAPFSTRKLPLTVALTGAENWVRKRYEEILAEPFDAENGPLWRAELCTFAGRGVILLAFCSAILDGESLYLIDRDLHALLAGPQADTLPAIDFDYADYAATQAEMVRSGQFEEPLAWWRDRLSGGPPASWKDGRGPMAVSLLYEQVIGPATGRALDAYAAAQRTTAPVVLLHEFMALVRDFDGDGDIWVSAATATRDMPGTEMMVGTFARQAIVRLSWQAGVDGLAHVQTALAETMDQPPVPHLLIKQALERAYPGAPSAFRYVFNYREVQPQADGDADNRDVAFRLGPAVAASAREEDILLMVMQSGDRRVIHWYLRGDRFDQKEAERLLVDFKRALDRRLFR